MEIIVLDRRSAEQYIPSGYTICISIRDVGAPLPQLSKNFTDVLSLEFDDCDDARGGFVPINDAQAVAIIDFFRRHRENGGERCVIHCNAGMCRSPGTAIGLLWVFAPQVVRHYTWRFPHFNRLVSSTIQRNGDPRWTPEPGPVKRDSTKEP